MRQADSKIIFFDIDGTLLNERGEITKALQAALIQLQKKGHEVCLASGRSKNGMVKELEAILEWDGYVLGNGVYGEYHKAVVMHEVMEQVFVDEFISYTQAFPNMGLIVESNSGAYVSADTSEIVYNAMKKVTYHEEISYEQFRQIFHVVEDISVVKMVNKMMYFGAGDSAEVMIGKFSKNFDFLPNSVTQTPNWEEGEIMIKGITKAVGIEKVIQFAGYDRKDVIAFGDGYNDLEMIEYAATGVAMGNGVAPLKKRADFITDTNRNDGVVKMLKQLGLIL